MPNGEQLVVLPSLASRVKLLPLLMKMVMMKMMVVVVLGMMMMVMLFQLSVHVFKVHAATMNSFMSSVQTAA